MDIKELVIGDWIYDCHDYYNRGMKKKPTQLDREGLIDLLCYCTSHDDLDLGCMSQPIPLTKEILEANGFEKREKKYVYGDINKLEDVASMWYSDFTHNRMIFNLYGKNGIIDYYPWGIVFVHQLQHALRLCGFNELADNFKVE